MGALVVAPDACSPAAAVSFLARELPNEDVNKLPMIHQEIQNLVAPMDYGPLKQLARGLLGISPHFFPNNLNTPMAEYAHG